MAEQFIVIGRITETGGRSIVGATVKVLDRDLRSEQLLGETVTNAEGIYEIKYADDMFRRAEKRVADLVIRVSSQEGIPLTLKEIQSNGATLPAPAIIFNAPAEAHIDLVVEPAPPLSEYERLILTLTP